MHVKDVISVDLGNTGLAYSLSFSTLFSHESMFEGDSDWSGKYVNIICIYWLRHGWLPFIGELYAFYLFVSSTFACD